MRTYSKDVKEPEVSFELSAGWMKQKIPRSEKNMDKILKAFDGHIRVNESNKTVEVYNEYGVTMRLIVDEETLAEFRKHYPSF